jgi:hypothetical protein
MFSPPSAAVFFLPGNAGAVRFPQVQTICGSAVLFRLNQM